MKNIIKRESDELVFPRCQITTNSLTLPENLTFDEWEQVGQTLRKIDGARLWWFGDWCNHGERKYGEKYTQALEASDYKKQTLKNAAWVAGKIEASRRRDACSYSAHAEVAPLAPADQDRWLDRAEKEDLTHREVRRLVQAEKKQVALPLPKGKYRVIYADPPWLYHAGGQHSGEAQETVLSTHYDSMTLEAISALPIGKLAGPEAVLFLWATSPALPEALQVIEAWGFEYKASFVWYKVKHNVGHYNSVRHELLLISTRGSCLPDSKKLIDSVQSIERTEHSRKPDRFREIIDEMYFPFKGRNDRIELFSRGKIPAHWDPWGDEAEK